MDGMYQDIIILLSMLFFGFWVIKKHYDNAWNIEQLEIEIKKAREKELSSYPKGISLNDLKKMQNDIIEQNQNCINLNAKINRNEKWTVETIDKLKDAVEMLGKIQAAQGQYIDDTSGTLTIGGQISVQDAVDTLVKSYEEGAGITTMANASEIEPKDV